MPRCRGHQLSNQIQTRENTVHEHRTQGPFQGWNSDHDTERRNRERARATILTKSPRPTRGNHTPERRVPVLSSSEQPPHAGARSLWGRPARQGGPRAPADPPGPHAPSSAAGSLPRRRSRGPDELATAGWTLEERGGGEQRGQAPALGPGQSCGPPTGWLCPTARPARVRRCCPACAVSRGCVPSTSAREHEEPGAAGPWQVGQREGSLPADRREAPATGLPCPLGPHAGLARCRPRLPSRLDGNENSLPPAPQGLGRSTGWGAGVKSHEYLQA